MQHKNVMHLLIPCLTEPEKLFPLKLSQLPEKSNRSSMSNSSKGEVQFLSFNKHDGRLLGLFLPQLRKFNFWLTEQYFIFQMKQDIKTY